MKKSVIGIMFAGLFSLVGCGFSYGMDVSSYETNEVINVLDTTYRKGVDLQHLMLGSYDDETRRLICNRVKVVYDELDSKMDLLEDKNIDWMHDKIVRDLGHVKYMEDMFDQACSEYGIDI